MKGKEKIYVREKRIYEKFKERAREIDDASLREKRKYKAVNLREK